ncbi:MAG: iron-containing alcohol dehydrogenase [Rhizobiales bacterium]|nr:iron-containing alcohol dehydrogenase [Hyphomicrobiales bacterium]MBI3674139.1 iron-containing alcohol dehydrogenase [Hyphomicrobiales bacterium]
MKPFVLSRVPEIIFGAGRLTELGPKATALAGRGAPILLVADPALAGLGITARALAILAEAGHPATVYDGFKGEPKATDIDAAAAIAGDLKAMAIVGLGGGSALDTAKLVACCTVTGLPASAYELCATPLPANRLPIIAIPTTAGTGSEVTRVSVFANAAKAKVWAWGEELKPDVAILDPELSVAVPPQVTAATGLDALVHAIEACTNKHATPGSDLYCHKAVSLIAANLERAVKNPADIEARGAMLLGSCYGGIGIDNCGTALAHNISHALADLAPIPHGRATGLAMLATIGWAAEGNPQAFARVAAAMGVADAVSGFDRLLRSTGIKVSLAGDGLELNRPELLAAHMALPANQPMRKSTLRYPSDADLLMLAEKVYALA